MKNLKGYPLYMVPFLVLILFSGLYFIACEEDETDPWDEPASCINAINGQWIFHFSPPIDRDMILNAEQEEGSCIVYLRDTARNPGVFEGVVDGNKLRARSVFAGYWRIEGTISESPLYMEGNWYLQGNNSGTWTADFNYNATY